VPFHRSPASTGVLTSPTVNDPTAMHDTADVHDTPDSPPLISLARATRPAGDLDSAGDRRPQPGAGGKLPGTCGYCQMRAIRALGSHQARRRGPDRPWAYHRPDDQGARHEGGYRPSARYQHDGLLRVRDPPRGFHVPLPAAH
jgi:hypothetical protein